MFFASKSKGFCVDIGENTTFVARLSQQEAPYVVEELKEMPSTDTAGLAEWIKGSIGKGSTGYAHATCGIYPEKRVVRRHTLDLKRIKDPTYFHEIYAQQFRIEPDKYLLKILNHNDGSEYDSIKATQKEVLFCGLPVEDVNGTQERLLQQGLPRWHGELPEIQAEQGPVASPRNGRRHNAKLYCQLGRRGHLTLYFKRGGFDDPGRAEGAWIERRGLGHEVVLFEHL